MPLSWLRKGHLFLFIGIAYHCILASGVYGILGETLLERLAGHIPGVPLFPFSTKRFTYPFHYEKHTSGHKSLYYA